MSEAMTISCACSKASPNAALLVSGDCGAVVGAFDDGEQK